MAGGFFHLLWLVLSICSAQVIITSTITATSTICPCTSQASSQTSSSTSSIAPTASPSTSTFSATTSAAPEPATTPFPIRIDTGSSQRKRAFYYVAFDNDTAIGVNTLGRAASFSIVNGYLLNDGMFVGSNTSTGYQNMRKYVSPATIVQGWSLAEDRTISLNGQAFTHGDGSADFCVSAQGAIILELTETAPACSDADLAAFLIPSSSSSTASNSAFVTTQATSVLPASSSVTESPSSLVSSLPSSTSSQTLTSSTALSSTLSMPTSTASTSELLTSISSPSTSPTSSALVASSSTKGASSTITSSLAITTTSSLPSITLTSTASSASTSGVTTSSPSPPTTAQTTAPQSPTTSLVTTPSATSSPTSSPPTTSSSRSPLTSSSSVIATTSPSTSSQQITSSSSTSMLTAITYTLRSSGTGKAYTDGYASRSGSPSSMTVTSCEGLCTADSTCRSFFYFLNSDGTSATCQLSHNVFSSASLETGINQQYYAYDKDVYYSATSSSSSAAISSFTTAATSLMTSSSTQSSTAATTSSASAGACSSYSNPTTAGGKMFHLNCGSFYFSNGQIATSNTVSSLGQCLALCAANSLCIAVDYYSSATYCYLLGSFVGNAVLNASPAYDCASLIH